jgi:N-formylglutamate amidohydrolase
LTTRTAGADLLADGAAVRRDLPYCLRRYFSITWPAAGSSRFRRAWRMYSLPSSLLLAPLDVHRAAVVLLDDHGVAGQLQHVGVGQRVNIALGFGDIDGAVDLPASCRRRPS